MSNLKKISSSPDPLPFLVKRDTWPAKVAGSVEKLGGDEASKSGETVQGKDKLSKDNLDAGLDLLMQMDKKIQSSDSADVGPTFDLVSYHDGTDWQVIIDNTDDGNLEKALKLRPFTVAQEYGKLTDMEVDTIFKIRKPESTMYECFWSIMHKFQISNIQGLEDLQRLSALLHRESEGAVRSRGDKAQPSGEIVSAM